MMNPYSKIIQQAQQFLKSKKPIQAFFTLEPSQNPSSQNPSSQNPHFASLILDCAYKGIWAAYSQSHFELMEYLARFSINILQKNPNQASQQFILAKTYNGLATSLYQLGKPNIQHNFQAQKIYSQLLLNTHQSSLLKKITQSKIKNDFGLIVNLSLQNSFPEAHQLALDSIQFAQKYRLPIEYALALKIMANLLFNHQFHSQAFHYFHQSASILQSLHSKNATSQAYKLYLLMAEHYLSIQKYQPAKKCLQQARIYLLKLKKTPPLYFCLLAHYFDSLKLKQKSLYYSLKAVSILIQHKKSFQFESHVHLFLLRKNYESFCLQTISKLLADQQNLKAFQLLQNLASQIFMNKILVNQISTQKSDSNHIPHTILSQRSSIQKKIQSLDPKNSHHSHQIQFLQHELYSCDEKIALLQHHSYSQKQFPHYKIPSFQSSQKIIPKNTLIIQFFYDSRSCFLFLISFESFNTLHLPCSSYQLIQFMTCYLSFIKNNLLLSDQSDQSHSEKSFSSTLQKWIISPLKPYVSTSIKQFLIVPFKFFHSFPLHHLFFSFFPHILLSYLPNFQAIHFLKNTPFLFHKALLVGDPNHNLPSSFEEISTISSFFPHSKSLIGPQAQKNIFLKLVKNFPFIHYSGHIHYDISKPLDSYLQFSSNPTYPQNSHLLFLKDIYRLNLNHVQFLSLAGCSSGLSTIYRGEELVGLTRGFFFSGVQSILATLWNIEDQSSKKFFSFFFENLQNHQGNQKIAFRNAYFLMKNQYPHPFFFSPFILYEGF